MHSIGAGGDSVRVLAYARVSTDEQAEEGYSIPAQRQRMADFCRSQWDQDASIEWFIDDGQSAKDLDRPALSTLRTRAAQGDLVVVLRLDRLTRSVLDLYTLLREWEQAGVFFRSVTEPYDTTSTEGRFMIGLLALLAEWERLRIGERVREVMSHTVREERRHLSRPPLGYSLSHGQLEVQPAEANLVREIFQRYAAGQGTRTIAQALNEKGALTKQGCQWSDFSVTYVLRNPVYTGMLSWGRVRSRGRRKEPGSDSAVAVQGNHPALVDQPTWRLVQRRLAERRRAREPRGSGTHPLAGLTWCACCGAPLRGVTQRRYRNGEPVPGRERRYYRCTGRERGSGCSLPYLRAAELECRVLQHLTPLAGLQTLEQVAARLLENGAPDPAIERRDLERRLHRWDHAYESGSLTHLQWQERTAALRLRLERLDTERTGTSEPLPQVARLMSDLLGLWPTLPTDAQRTIMCGFISRVVAGADGQVEITRRSYPRLNKPGKGHPLMA